MLLEDKLDIPNYIDDTPLRVATVVSDYYVRMTKEANDQFSRTTYDFFKFRIDDDRKLAIYQ